MSMSENYVKNLYTLKNTPNGFIALDRVASNIVQCYVVSIAPYHVSTEGMKDLFTSVRTHILFGKKVLIKNNVIIRIPDMDYVLKTAALNTEAISNLYIGQDILSDEQE